MHVAPNQPQQSHMSHVIAHNIGETRGKSSQLAAARTTRGGTDGGSAGRLRVIDGQMSPR